VLRPVGKRSIYPQVDTASDGGAYGDEEAYDCNDRGPCPQVIATA